MNPSSLEHGYMPFQNTATQNPQYPYIHQGLEGQKLMMQQQQLFSNGNGPIKGQMVPVQTVPGQGGNYIYTRRIIDPKSNSVAAEERIQ